MQARIAGGISLLLLSFVLPSPVNAEGHTNAPPLPPLVLWAWERSEDLSYVDPTRTAVAFHAMHIRIDGDQLRVKRRRHPLRVPPTVPLVAVAHFSVANPDLSLIPRVRDLVLSLAQERGVRGIQLDFEATPSQRRFHDALAREVRAGLSPDHSFSTTALASWCMADRWVDPALFDEVVPMFFDMGPEDRGIRASFAAGQDFAPSYCRQSVGVRLGNPLPAQFAGRRIYVFNPKPWTETSYRKLVDSL